MEIAPNNQIVTEKERKDIVNSLNKFDHWLVKKKIVSKPSEISFVDLPYADDDWTMIVKDGTVSFNTFFRKKCSAEYFKSIVLHEFFHLAVQKVPHKDDAVKIKDDFGAEMMKLIDIEADYFTALFYKEEFKYDLISYLRLYYDGGKVFSDRWIRVGKLERFIGTLLSITNMFFTHSDNPKKPIGCDLYLPCVTPLYMDDNMHVLVIRKEHIYFDNLGVKNTDFVKMKKCYSTSASSLSFKEYATQILNFCTTALRMTLPVDVKNQLKKVKD